MTSRYFEILFTYSNACPIPSARSRNGSARPREKINKRKAPEAICPDVEARTKIEPSTGPTQGVHPNAKDAPNKNELDGFPGVSDEANDNFFCLFKKLKNGSLKICIKYKPKNITSIPPIRVRIRRYFANATPAAPNKVPKRINTTEKPITYNNPFKNTFFLIPCNSFLECLPCTDTPLIKPRYPGTSGNVHGAKNVRTPAINAGIMSVVSIIVSHQFLNQYGNLSSQYIKSAFIFED